MTNDPTPEVHDAPLEGNQSARSSFKQRIFDRIDKPRKKVSRNASKGMFLGSLAIYIIAGIIMVTLSPVKGTFMLPWSVLPGYFENSFEATQAQIVWNFYWAIVLVSILPMWSYEIIHQVSKRIPEKYVLDAKFILVFFAGIFSTALLFLSLDLSGVVASNTTAVRAIAITDKAVESAIDGGSDIDARAMRALVTNKVARELIRLPVNDDLPTTYEGWVNYKPSPTAEN